MAADSEPQITGLHVEGAVQPTISDRADTVSFAVSTGERRAMGSESEPDPMSIVRRGYDELSYRYRADHDAPTEHLLRIAELTDRMQGRASVLDLGCGCGVPVARDLSDAGFDVTGIDISEVQIQRARRLVPAATFVRGDFTEAEFPVASFDAVVCLYAIIHVPLDLQPGLITSIAGWVRPGGWLLMTGGQDAWTGSEDGWLGGTSTMLWSQFDAASYRDLLIAAGFSVEEQRFIPEGASGHSLFWARRR
jgi:SAM-dependent methyltransferase